MANRWLQQFFFSYVHYPVWIQGDMVVGTSGAVGTLKGSGIKAVTHLTTGMYRIDLEDSFNRYLSGQAGFVSTVTGSNVTAGSFATNTTYVITAVGSTNWQAIGLKAPIAAVGMAFVATGAGTGSGTAKVAASAGVLSVEVVGNPQLTTNTNNPYVIIACYDAADSLADPAAGSVLGFQFWMRNSSVKGKGE